jgi:cytochrome c oxidase subunit III
MNTRAVLDLSRLSPYTNWTRATLWWGFMGMILIESAVVGSLIASYLYLKTGVGAGAWPPAPHKPPELLLPSINTAVLIASSLVVHWADTGIRKGDERRLKVGMLGAIALGTLFLVLKYVEYHDSEYWWDSHAYGSIVWMMVGFHSAHVIAVVLKAVIVDVLAWRGYFNRYRRLGVEVNGVYWHFVVIIWIPLFITIYLVPRL